MLGIYYPSSLKRGRRIPNSQSTHTHYTSSFSLLVHHHTPTFSFCTIHPSLHRQFWSVDPHFLFNYWFSCLRVLGQHHTDAPYLKRVFLLLCADKSYRERPVACAGVWSTCYYPSVACGKSNPQVFIHHTHQRSLFQELRDYKLFMFHHLSLVIKNNNDSWWKPSASFVLKTKTHHVSIEILITWRAFN